MQGVTQPVVAQPVGLPSPIVTQPDEPLGFT